MQNTLKTQLLELDLLCNLKLITLIDNNILNLLNVFYIFCVITVNTARGCEIRHENELFLLDGILVHSIV